MVDKHQERPAQRELTVRDNRLATAEYEFLRSNLPSPKISVVQLAGGTDISIFSAFKPEDEVRWVESDTERVALVTASGKAKENQVVVENPLTYRKSPPADIVVLRGAHIPKGDDTIRKFYESVDANLAEGGLLVTNHYQHQRDAKHFLSNPAYELVGVLTNSNGKPPVMLNTAHNDEIKQKLAGDNNPQRTKENGKIVDEYAEQTFVFQKKAKTAVTPPKPPSPPHETPSAPAPKQPESHAPGPTKPQEPSPQPSHTPVAATVEPKPEPKNESPKKKEPIIEQPKKEPTKKETFTKATETSQKWIKSKLKSVQKVLGDLGLTAGSSLWELIGTVSTPVALGATLLTANPIFLAGLIPSAIGGLIGWQTAKMGTPAEKSMWAVTKVAAATPTLFPFGNIASAVTQFLANFKYRKPAKAH